MWKFASCDGCQLSLLDLEDEFLLIAGAVRIAHFPEASRGHLDGPYDLSLVEGSITTPADAERIREVREQSRMLVTIGACATAGGIQGLRNFASTGDYAATVYAHPEYIATLDTSTPIADHVTVDYELHGCPVDRYQLLEVVTAALAGRTPVVPGHSVCQECKASGTVCLLVSGTRAVPRSRHPLRVRGPLPGPGATLLRVLRTHRRGQHRLADRQAPGRRCHLRSRGTSVPHLHRRGARVRLGLPGRRGGGGRRRRGHRGGGGWGRETAARGVAMSHGTSGRRSIGVEGIARVEGEGSLHIDVDDGVVTDVSLSIFEPPRFFEALLEGRQFTEAPDITARICGICPVAYQTSACSAMEDACGTTLPDPVRALRRLLYCGEWIQSHALHVYLLHAPDFLGCADAVELAEVDRAAVERGLAIKRTGNRLMEVVGGRSVHPVNVRVGGFYRAPAPEDLAAMVGPLETALEDALATVAWVSTFDFPDVEGDYRFVSLRHPGAYPIEGGRVVSSDGLDLSPADFADLVVEEHVERSTALHARLGGELPYLTGPLARYALNADALPDVARRAATAAGLGPICTNPFRSIVVRSVELVVACAEALRIVAAYEPPDPPAAAVTPRAAVGTGVSEAPRGPAPPPLPHRRRRRDPRRPHHAPHVAEPAHHGGRPAARGPGRTRPRRRRPHVAVRAGRAQPRPVHLVRRALPRRHGRPVSRPAGSPAGRSVVVAGFGTEYRRDDGVGAAVAARLAGRPGITDIGPVADPLDLLGRWDDADLAVVVDALRSGAAPGTLRTVELPDGAPAPAAATSTHGIGLAGVVRLARAVGRAPGRVVVVGIEGADFGQGTGLTPAVSAAVPDAVTEVLRIIAGGPATP